MGNFERLFYYHMETASEYSLYLKKRTSNVKLLSEAEDLCRYCISYFDKKKDFVLLFDKQDRFLFCYCHYVPNPKDPTKPFFYIEIPLSFEHNIGKLCDESQLNEIDKVNTLFYYDGIRYTFDEYYNQFLPEGFMNKLCDAIKELPSQKECSVIVSGPLAGNYSFLYALQEKFEEVRSEDEAKKRSEDSEITPRCYFPSEMKQGVDLFEESSVVKYTLENLSGKGIAIPLDEETLNSTFWKDVTWRDIASASEQVDGEIAGVPIRFVGLRLIVDAYRNIFLTIKDSRSVYKTILLLDKFEIQNRTNLKENKNTEGESNYKENYSSVKRAQNNNTNINKTRDPKTKDRKVQSRAIHSDTIIINEVEFPYKHITEKIENFSKEELGKLKSQLEEALKLVLDCDIFLADTNFWIQEDSESQGKKWKYRWIVDYAIRKYWKGKKKDVVVLQTDVYDEIENKSYSMDSAHEANLFIQEKLLPLDLAIVPEVRADRKRDAYADPQLFELIDNTLKKEQNKRLTVVSADRAIGRWQAHCKNVIKSMDIHPPTPIFIKPIDLVGLFQMRNIIDNYFHKLKQ